MQSAHRWLNPALLLIVVSLAVAAAAGLVLLWPQAEPASRGMPPARLADVIVRHAQLVDCPEDSFVAVIPPCVIATIEVLAGPHEDAAGNAYVTGSTESSDFPTTAGAFQRSDPGPANRDAFVIKFSEEAPDQNLT